MTFPKKSGHGDSVGFFYTPVQYRPGIPIAPTLDPPREQALGQFQLVADVPPPAVEVEIFDQPVDQFVDPQPGLGEREVYRDLRLTAVTYTRWGIGGALAAEAAKLPGLKPSS